MANKIATWKYVDNLCGVTGKSHNPDRCTSYASLMTVIQYDSDYKGLSISGTHQSGELIAENELTWTNPQKYHIYCTFYLSTTLQNVNAIWITNAAMINPASANTCPSFCNSDIGTFGTLSASKFYTFLLAGTTSSTGYDSPPGTVQISNAARTGLVTVSTNSTVYITIKYNNYQQYFTLTGTLTTRLRTI